MQSLFLWSCVKLRKHQFENTNKCIQEDYQDFIPHGLLTPHEEGLYFEHYMMCNEMKSIFKVWEAKKANGSESTS